MYQNLTAERKISLIWLVFLWNQIDREIIIEEGPFLRVCREEHCVLPPLFPHDEASR